MKRYVAFMVFFVVTPLIFAAEAMQKYPNVMAVEVSQNDGIYRFSVTLSSPYDTPKRYADAFRIKDVENNVYGIRKLLHDHGYEQPFTRSLVGVEIPRNRSLKSLLRGKTVNTAGEAAA